MSANPATPRRDKQADLDQSNATTMSSAMKRSGVGSVGYLAPKKRTEAVLCISFNQDKTCIALGTNYGYKIFNSRNFKKVGERDLDMPVARIQMLYRSNLILLVKGTAENMKMPGNTLIFWDDKTNDATSKLVLKSNINKVKMRKDMIFIIHENQIQIFSLELLQVVKVIETKVNPYGRSFLLSHLYVFVLRHHEAYRLS